MTSSSGTVQNIEKVKHNVNSKHGHSLNMDERKQCEFFGFIETYAEQSLLILHACSTNVFNTRSNMVFHCGEQHVHTPRSIMTKGNSSSRGSFYRNAILGNADKLMVSYERIPSHDYTMYGACSVVYEGDIHFFGGFNYFHHFDFTRQHFVIETQRSGKG